MSTKFQSASAAKIIDKHDTDLLETLKLILLNSVVILLLQWSVSVLSYYQ